MRPRDLLFLPRGDFAIFTTASLPTQASKRGLSRSVKGGGLVKGLGGRSTHRVEFLLTLQARTGMCHSHQLSRATRRWKSNLTLVQSPRHNSKRYRDGQTSPGSTAVPALSEITAAHLPLNTQPTRSRGVAWTSQMALWRCTSPPVWVSSPINHSHRSSKRGVQCWRGC